MEAGTRRRGLLRDLGRHVRHSVSFPAFGAREPHAFERLAGLECWRQRAAQSFRISTWSDDHCGSTAARLTSCIFQSSVDFPPVESAGSSRQMPVANRVVPVQADQCRNSISWMNEYGTGLCWKVCVSRVWTHLVRSVFRKCFSRET